MTWRSMALCAALLPAVMAFSATAVSTTAADAAAQPISALGQRNSLDAALSAIRPELIRADLEYLACDDMAGRDTPSTEQRLAARFLRNRLQRLGLQPGAKDGWFQTYPVTWRKVKEPETRAWFEHGDRKVELTFFRDWFLGRGDLVEGDLAGGVIFVGKGTKEEIAQTLALRGKVALAIDRGDGGDFVESTAAALKETGAVALLLMRPEGGAAAPYEQDPPASLQSLRRGSASWPRGEPSTRLPRAYLSQSGARALLELAGGEEPRVGQELGPTFHEVVAVHGGGKALCENVCGFWPGANPERSREVIVVSAHYDHIGIEADGRVYNGADDNGSGTVGLLALAEALSELGPLERSVLLIWVSGEEKGLWGSQAWSDAPWLPDGAHAVANINIDMIGRNAPQSLLVTPTSRHPAYNGLTKIAERLASSEGFAKLESADDYYTRSDHANFARLKIPVAFLFANVHADYHQLTDDVEKIDFDKISRVTRLVLRMLDELQGEELLPTH